MERVIRIRMQTEALPGIEVLNMPTIYEPNCSLNKRMRHTNHFELT